MGIPIASFLIYLEKHARIQMGSNFDNVFFLIDEGKEDPNTTISGPSLARQQMVFCWRADDGPTLNAGLVAL